MELIKRNAWPIKALLYAHGRLSIRLMSGEKYILGF